MYKNIGCGFIIFFLLTCFNAHSQERIISKDELPSSIQLYITTHFMKHEILKCEEETKNGLKTYEVKLDSAVKLEFDTKNNIKEIKAKSKLPDSVIPSSILSYVKQNYTGRVIIEWELEKKNQQVELDNGLELEFTMAGKFLRIDR